MLMRSKAPLAIGLSCLASAVLAGGAVAHGGHGDRGGHGRSALELEVSGVVTALTAPTPTTDGSITVSPGGTLAPWTCAIPANADTSAVVVNTTVAKLRCRDRNGVLTARRMRTTSDTTGSVRLEATGLVTAFTAPASATPVTPPAPVTPTTPATPATPAPLTTFSKSDTPPVTDPAPTTGTPSTGTPGSITIDPGTGLPPVTCVVTDQTRVRSTPVVGTDTARVACDSENDALVAWKIRVKGQNGNGGHHGHRGHR